MLTLDRLDLLPEHAETNCSRTRFEHFKPDVRRAVAAVGRARFEEYDRSNYNAIYPPKPEDGPDSQPPSVSSN